jgi:hypothetical protein
MTQTRKVITNHAATVQPCAQVDHPSADVPYTRVIEYKHLLNQTSPHTVLHYEHMRRHEHESAGSEPLFPIPTRRNLDLYRTLRRDAMRETYQKNVFFVGRLATYRHVGPAEAVGDALDHFVMHADVHIVQSVYNENLAWTARICAALAPTTRIAWFVYVKKPNRTVLESEIAPGCRCHVTMKQITYLPNVGRESHSFITYITTVSAPGKRVVFLQGGVNRYRKPDWDVLIRNAVHGLHAEPFVPLSYTRRSVSGVFVGPRRTFLLCCTKEVANLTTMVAGEINPQVDMNTLQHSYRGEFIVFGANVLQVARVFGAELAGAWVRALSKEDNAPAAPIGHAFERL